MAIEKVIIQNFKKFKNPFEIKFNESLSKLYVAVTRAKYSVGFVYKTKRIPSENIGERWILGNEEGNL